VVQNHEGGTDDAGGTARPGSRGGTLGRERGRFRHVDSRRFTRTNSTTGGCSDASRLAGGFPEGEDKIERVLAVSLETAGER
jgi:hypothetical protein